MSAHSYTAFAVFAAALVISMTASAAEVIFLYRS